MDRSVSASLPGLWVSSSLNFSSFLSFSSCRERASLSLTVGAVDIAGIVGGVVRDMELISIDGGPGCVEDEDDDNNEEDEE